MYYQHTEHARCDLRNRQQSADDGRISLSHQHCACFYDCRLASSAFSTTSPSGNFAQAFHNPAVHDHRSTQLRTNFRNLYGSGTPAPMTSLHHRDVPHDAVTSRPSPYDCKPPYSYISLIAMAIECSPDRRFVKAQIPLVRRFSPKFPSGKVSVKFADTNHLACRDGLKVRNFPVTFPLHDLSPFVSATFIINLWNVGYLRPPVERTKRQTS